MAGIYDEIEIEDMKYDEENFVYTYPCPCGDKFSIALEELYDGEDIASCPSCTLRIRVIYDDCDLPELPSEYLEEEIEVVEKTVVKGGMIEGTEKKIEAAVKLEKDEKRDQKEVLKEGLTKEMNG